MTEAAIFAPRRLGHVNLWVENIGRSEAFYHETCGLMIEFTEPDLEATFLGVGHTAHDLGMMRITGGKDRYGRDGTLQLPGTIGLEVGLNHIAWELENEAVLVEAYRRMRARGLKHDLLMDHQIAHSVYIFDPDGNYNEFYCDTIEDWRSVLKGEMGLISATWNPETAEGFRDGRYPKSPTIKRFEPAPLKPARITHLVLETKRFDAMLDFYRDVAGLRVVEQVGNATYLNGALDDYGFALVLVAGAVSGYRHAAFELDDEVSLERGAADLLAGGTKIEHALDLPWKRSLFLRDPDGLLSEWYVRRSGARRPDNPDSDLFLYSV